jgi:hypothetical protein
MTGPDRHWNFRIVRRYNRHGQVWLEITEVHYQNGKPIAFADKLLTPAETVEDGETEDEIVESLRATLEKMMDATKEPILDERKDFGKTR